MKLVSTAKRQRLWLMDTCMKLLNLSCYIKMLYFTVALIGLISTILSCVKNSRKYKISLKHMSYSNVGR